MTRTRPKMIVNLALSPHTLEAIQQVLTARPATNHCTTTQISHPTLPLTMTQLHSLNGIIQANLNQNLTHRVLFHYLRITAMPTLLPSDRTLKITLDNAIHTLTPPRIGNMATPHHLHLYLNPHDRPPFLQHRCTGNEPTPYRIVITTSLPSQCSESSRARRRPMLRTTSHAPDLVTTLTFLADSIQYQQSIMTLATHLLLTVPIITRRQPWNIIREKESHRHTLQLILATVTLKRYHLVWHTLVTESHATPSTQQRATTTVSNIQKHTTPPPPRNRPPKRRRHTRL